MGKKPGIDITLPFRIARKLNQLQAVAVQTHHIGPLLYGGLGARLAGINQLVHTEHDAWHLRNNKRRKLQDRIIRIIKPILVADSFMVAEKLRQISPKHHYQIIRNGVDCTRFKPGDSDYARRLQSLPMDVRLIGCAGRLELVKDQATLIRAHALLPNDCHLALAGDGSQKLGLMKLAADLGTSRRVHFLGNVDDMPTFYRALDVFCLPSLNEGMPLSPLEAQACGIPTVVTDVGGAAETLCPETGLLVEPDNPEKLSNALQQQLSSREERNPRHFPLTSNNLRQVISAYQRLMSPEGVL